jgi:hypothetical protein
MHRTPLHFTTLCLHCVLTDCISLHGVASLASRWAAVHSSVLHVSCCIVLHCISLYRVASLATCCIALRRALTLYRYFFVALRCVAYRCILLHCVASCCIFLHRDTSRIAAFHNIALALRLNHCISLHGVASLASRWATVRSLYCISRAASRCVALHYIAPQSAAVRKRDDHSESSS